VVLVRVPPGWGRSSTVLDRLAVPNSLDAGQCRVTMCRVTPGDKKDENLHLYSMFSS
jgi:hypothetical protein